MDRLLKFGGTSVGTPERIRSVLEIVQQAYEASPSVAVVVSAFGGVTDQLIALGRLAAGGSEDYSHKLEELIERHRVCVSALISPDRLSIVLQAVELTLSELSRVLEGVSLVKELSPKTLDLVMSFGERLSAYIISEALKSYVPQSTFLDAREVIKTDRAFGCAKVDFGKTDAAIQAFFQGRSEAVVITGFIGSTVEAETTTLGRGGSDYTAAIVGAALNARVIEIWTDVDGVMTADPRKEPYAFSIPHMSYKEAMEMSYFGAKVIHPPTIIPALDKGIPLLIKNTFRPDSVGTLISEDASRGTSQICGISSIDDAVLLNIQGSGMVGVCGIARRLFGVLAEKGINIILISQGSSEHSICIAVSPGSAQYAKESIEKEFALEIRASIIDEVAVQRNLSVVAVVGEQMRSHVGVAGNLFGSLGKNGINVVAIAQGSSELNITVVVRKEDEVKAIRTIHEAFFLSPKKTLHLFLVGVGLIGRTLLDQIKRRADGLRSDHALDLRVVGLANSRTMVFDQQGISLADWEKRLEASDKHMHVASFVKEMVQLNLMNTVFVDCTSSQAVADAYESILHANRSIVTPNKKANSGSYEAYQKLRALTIKNGARFFYGANVGAGLPVISTINELRRGGDKILSIEAILSGTMSYLFNSFVKGTSFSEVLQDAQKRGFTEPDPRDDLNGMDVARKLLILARESGFPLEMEAIAVERLLPEECLTVSSVSDFYEKLRTHDAEFNARREHAERDGKVLRYIARYENGRGTVALQAVGPEHPFYHLSGSDNVISITSEFYRENPLVIKGQGAGAEVTAGKVFADIVQLGLAHNI